MTPYPPHVTIGIVNYNGINSLPQTLEALCHLQYPDFSIIVADNGSTDGSLEWVKENHPHVCCLDIGQNLGSAGGRNALIEATQSEYVLLMDNDITMEPDVLTRLMDVMQSVPDVGVCHPEICDVNDPVSYHYNGGYIHYLGALISREDPADIRERPPYEQYDVISAAVMLMRHEVADKIGGFDTDYFFNWEDGDFTARLTLAGYKCLNVPEAIVHHRSKPRGTSKVFYQIRNRWYFMLKLYSWRTLLLISPIALIFELLQAAFLLKKGALGDYLRGNWAAVKDIPSIMAKRREFKKLKTIRDKEWLKAGQMYVPPQLNAKANILDTLQNLFYKFCTIYWSIVSPLC